MKLKQLLWDSLKEWDKYTDNWMKADFFKINTEEMQNNTMKYAKIVIQLEKGLPPNNVIPVLKAKVENIKEKV